MMDIVERLRARKATWMEAIAVMEAGADEIKRLQADCDRWRVETAAVNIELHEHKDEIERLQAQLPEGMKHCTILFKECEKGHGRLTATNWIDHGCHFCEIERLKVLLKEARQYVSDAGSDGDPETQSLSGRLLIEIDAALPPRK